MLAGIFFGVDQLFCQRAAGLKFSLQPTAVVIEVHRQMLLAADGDPQPNPQQRLGGEENLQLQQVAEPHPDLTGDSDHHAAQQPGEHAALPAELPRHHHVGQEHHDQQQPLQGRREHHLGADADDKKQAAPDDQRGAQGRVAGIEPQQVIAVLLA